MESKDIDYKSSWHSFVNEVQNSILPIYMKHELTFDPGGVHGRMHICRSVIFSEWMARFYYERLSSRDIDFYAIRTATALHDSGRQANGIDYWEADSVNRCLQYVESNSPVPDDPEYPQYVASLIEKVRKGDTSKWIVYDADVLEIMRPCCGRGGLGGFKRKFLHFAGDDDQIARAADDAKDMREALIQEVWRWIIATEPMKIKLFHSPTYLMDLLEKLESEKQEFLLLSCILS